MTEGVGGKVHAYANLEPGPMELFPEPSAALTIGRHIQLGQEGCIE